MPARPDAGDGATRSSRGADDRRGQSHRPRHAPYACATVGFVQVSPNSRNTIPGRVFFTVDFRHPDNDVLSAMDEELRTACTEAAASQKLEADVKEFWYFPPTPFDERLVGAVRAAARAQALPHRDIVSGAGHDAVYMARVAPAAMIFVPCVDGISHNEIEDAQARRPHRWLRRAVERGARIGRWRGDLAHRSVVAVTAANQSWRFAGRFSRRVHLSKQR